MYSFGATTGKLRWSNGTGDIIYSSAAVWRGNIQVGSYDGTFRALDARTGHTDWSYDSHGRISGSATIVGRAVYFASLGRRRTYALGISTGRVLWEWGSGSFDPVISDGHNIYLTGYSGLYGLAPY